MNPFTKTTALTLVAALAVSARAQDSVSKQAGLPGDALDAYSTGDQVANYVVDLTPFTTSWGTQFGVAPLIKASKDSAAPQAFFNHLINAQSISNTRKASVAFPFTQYESWNAPGFGVNPDPNINDPGIVIDTSNFKGPQFAVGFVEAGGTNFNSNNAVGGVVNFKTNDPKRLYVTRTVGAQNATGGTCKTGALGFGAVDSNGNMVFRADNFGAVACAGLLSLTGNNYFGVDLLGRSNGFLNVVSSDYPGGLFQPGVTDWLVQNSADTYNTPTILPQQFTPNGYLILGTNFAKEFVRGSAFPLTEDLSHFAPGVSDQRGNLSYTHNKFPNLFGAGSAGTAAQIAKIGTPTDTINVFGISSTGAVTGKLSFTLPAAVIDNSTGFSSALLGPGPNEFDHYHSQVAFQGGNGQVAVGQDLKGDLLLAAEVNYPTIGTPDNPINYIAVARVNKTTGAVMWTMAGYNDGSFDGSGAGLGSGKPIKDGPGGATIGRMVPLFAVTGGAPLGPSVSSPMIDSVGNVWFLAACEFFKVDPLTGPYSDFDTALLRAVYNPTTFSYELEKVFEVGNVFHGQNSNTDYQIRFMGIADSNSVSSGTAFSGNMLQYPHSTVNPACVKNLDPKSSLSLGGLVINASIVYDVNGDGNYESLSSNPATEDQQYAALLYVGSVSTSSTGGAPVVISGPLPGAGHTVTVGPGSISATQVGPIGPLTPVIRCP